MSGAVLSVTLAPSDIMDEDCEDSVEEERLMRLGEKLPNPLSSTADGGLAEPSVT